MPRILILALALIAALRADPRDPYCSAYPESARLIERLSGLETPAEGLQRAQRVSFIDDRIFDMLAAQGVEAAPLADDAAFLRRATIDLTGRLPTLDEVDEFLADESSTKRSQLINRLMSADAFVDQWTLFFANRFEVASNYYTHIGVPGRNAFHRFLREFVEQDRPYDQVVREMITASGDSHVSGAANYLMRAVQVGDPVQDTWDVLANRTSAIFLGVQTQCVTCHDGRNHLEQINLDLTSRNRDDLLRFAAFFARTDIRTIAADSGGLLEKGFIRDRARGAYHNVFDADNPGPRPSRTGGPFRARYMFSGEQPRSRRWRQELARMVTADRQFARATVNYLWAHFFRRGIVDPPDAFDLARQDPDNPPPAPWTIQPSHPELLEELADEFIRQGYKIRPIIRLIAQSNAYQLSSRYPGEWKPEYTSLFAKHIPRRLSAEEVYDALAEATLTRPPLVVQGFDKPVLYASQLPDPTEPREQYGALALLDRFGRGDWWQRGRNTRSSVVQALFLMNSPVVNLTLFGNSLGLSSNRVARVMAEPLNDEQAVRRLFLASLGRQPRDEELDTILSRDRTNREQWLGDVLWALVNRIEFVFNH